MAADPLSPLRYLCGSSHPVDLDAMVANLMLTEGKQGLPALADPIRSRNVMETCPAEFSAVWAYNPSSREYVYVVAVKATGNQASLAYGTNVELGEQRKNYTVGFTLSENADSARLTFSDLSVDQSTFWFAELKLAEQ
jgi:hypothetical protein